jgi:hypothetical protein
VPRLGLVAPGLQRLERAAAEQSHPVLRVAHRAAGRELEQRPRAEVGEPPRQRHAAQIVEPVADDEVGVAAGRQEGRDRSGGMLPVGVDQEHCPRRG